MRRLSLLLNDAIALGVSVALACASGERTVDVTEEVGLTRALPPSAIAHEQREAAADARRRAEPSQAASASAATKTTCGQTRATPCPLQAWMRSVETAFDHDDFGTLEQAFTRLAKMRPEGYEAWSTYADAGKQAANAHDVRAVDAACKACHATFREQFRHASIRERATP